MLLYLTHVMKLTAEERIRVIIADDSTIFRTGLISTLQQEPQIEIIDQAGNGKELVRSVETHNPDVVITDIHMPIMDGIQATSIIADRFPATGIIALSMLDSEDVIMQMFNAGAKGYILKSADTKEIVTAVTSVSKNSTYYSNGSLSRFIARSQMKRRKLSFPDLTDKELKIVKLICQQQSSKEIASKLNTTVRAVESAKERIQSKTGARNMVGIALYAVSKTIVPLNEICDLFY